MGRKKKTIDVSIVSDFFQDSANLTCAQAAGKKKKTKACY